MEPLSQQLVVAPQKGADATERRSCQAVEDGPMAILGHGDIRYSHSKKAQKFTLW